MISFEKFVALVRSLVLFGGGDPDYEGIKTSLSCNSDEDSCVYGTISLNVQHDQNECMESGAEYLEKLLLPVLEIVCPDITYIQAIRMRESFSLENIEFNVISCDLEKLYEIIGKMNGNRLDVAEGYLPACYPTVDEVIKALVADYPKNMTIDIESDDNKIIDLCFDGIYDVKPKNTVALFKQYLKKWSNDIEYNIECQIERLVESVDTNDGVFTESVYLANLFIDKIYELMTFEKSALLLH